MTKHFTIILFFLLALPTVAQQRTIRGHVFDDNREPIVGATVVCPTDGHGVATNADGLFQIVLNDGNRAIRVAFLGFETQEIPNASCCNPMTIVLEQDATMLDEFTVTQRAVGLVTLRDATIQTQRITRAELCRAACCNLSESFETNASVDVSFSDATTGARQIRLLGLDGFYIQMLTENIPNFRGVAQPFGMDYIPGSWIESISISKGTSSVRNGFEALAGQINVEYKKPQTMDRLFVNLYAAEKGRLEANVVSGIVLNEHLSTGLFFHYSQQQTEHDKNDDGFLDDPTSRQLSLLNRWHYRSGRYASQYLVRFTNELRESGQVSSRFDDPFRISFNTNRGEFFTKQSFMIDDGDLPESVALIAATSVHDQRSMFDKTEYDIRQRNIYLSAMYDNNFLPHHSFLTGLSMNHDGFDETLSRGGTNINLPFSRNETVFGGFAEYTFNHHDELVLMGGIRGDYSDLHGFFVTPRMHIRYAPKEWINLRASAGKGFRTAHVLAENNFLLASSRQINIANNLAQEQAWNTGFNVTFHIPIRHRELTITGEYYHTRFVNQVVVDRDSDPNAVFFYNLSDYNGRSFTNVAQIEASYSFFNGFTLMAAYRFNRAMTEFRHPVTRVETGLLPKPLQSHSVGIATASYMTPRGRWQFDLTGQFNGGGRMPTPCPDNPLWEKDFPPFNVFLGQITKNFTNLSIYAGVENIFDFRQPDPIIDATNPRGDNFDATMIWGPVMGRNIYVGLRWNIPRV